MLPPIGARLLGNGAVGPLDEILSFGLPLAVFIGLYFWSRRDEKRKRPPPAGPVKPSAKDEPRAGPDAPKP